MAISRKVSPRATVRNRIKRIIRDTFRHAQGQLANLDFVVIGRPGLGKLPAEELRASLQFHWKKLSQQACEKS
jgi:ribonuclease P protein component